MTIFSFSNLLSISLRSFIVLALFIISAQASTTINVSGTVVVPQAKRMGVNLRGHNYYDSSQFLKNLVNQNPGFEPQLYQSIIGCASGGGDVCTDNQVYDTWPNHYWQYGTFRVISGQAKGRTGSIVDSTTGNPYSQTTYQLSAGSPAIAPGDYIVVEQKNSGIPITGTVNSQYADTLVQGWWADNSGGGTFSPDASPSDQAPNTAGVQCLKMDASGGRSLNLRGAFDSTAGQTFVQLRGPYQVSFKARLLSGSGNLQVSLTRNGTYLNQLVSLSTSWQTYTLPFTANENGSAIGTAWLGFSVTDTALLLDDVSLTPVGGDGTNNTVYSDAMVNTLRTLKPGILRDWEAQLGESLDNSLTPAFGRMPSGFSVHYDSSFSQEGLHEFLQLCELVGAEPWYVVPQNWSPTDMQNLMEYLGGSAGTAYGAKRAALGHPVPWTNTFSTIHIEFGNENWNYATFAGGSIGQLNFANDLVIFAQRASELFGAAKSTSYYQAGKFDLVIGGQAENPYTASVESNASTQNDSYASAPYIGTYSTDGNDEQLFAPLFAQSEWWSQSGGFQGQNAAAVKGSLHPVPLSVYEENLNFSEGLSQSTVNAYLPSLGAGLATGNLMLAQLRDLGIINQNMFSLAQFNFPHNNQVDPIWGMVYDMGVTDRRRPQFLSMQLINQAIGSGTDVLQTSQTGDDPTWSGSFTPDGSTVVQVPNAHDIESYAFANGSIILINLNRSSAHDVTFSGAYAPSGSLNISTLNSGSLRDTNENSNVVAIATSHVDGFNPSQPFTLPAHSMTLLLPSSGNTDTSPIINAQPQSVSVSAGQSATFSVTASANPAPTYQWQSFSNNQWVDVVGQTQASYTLTNVQSGQDGSSYHVVVSNRAGSVTSVSATLSVSGNSSGPVIVTSPQNVTVLAGQPASFSVTATGIPTPTYQWQYLSNGTWTNYSGFTQSTLTFSNAQLNQNGTNIRVVVSNSGGDVASSVVILSVNSSTSPGITVNVATPSSLTGSPGDVLSLTTNWSGGPAPASDTIFVHFVDANGTILFGADYNPSTPSDQWGSTYSQTTTFGIPSGMPFGTYPIMVGLYSASGRLTLNPGPGVVPDNEQRYQIGTLIVSDGSGIPAPASNLVGSSIDPTTIGLTWQANSTNENQFIVLRRSPFGSVPYTEIGRTGFHDTQFTDSGLNTGWDYQYEIIATNDFGNAAPSNQITVQAGVTNATLLPAPSITVPLTAMTVTDAVVASYPLSFDVAGYQWLLTPLSSTALTSTSQRSMTASAGQARLVLGSLGVPSGAYRIQVAAVLTTGAVSPWATAKAQLVNGSFASVSLSAGQVRVYPNPWRDDKHHNVPITFDSMPDGSEVEIFTTAARHITTLTVRGSKATWDSTSVGNVASGIYLYTAKDPQGNKSKGKFAIVH